MMKAAGNRMSMHDYPWVTNHPERKLSQAKVFAMMTAERRESQTLELADLVAGLYIACLERLQKYWEDVEQIEAFVEDHCHINSERWLHWYECCQKIEKSAKWSFGAFSVAGRSKLFKDSQEVSAAFRRAEEMTPLRHTLLDKELPVITVECLLLSIAQLEGIEFSRRLRESGLDLESLEQDVRSSKRQPRF